VTEFVGKDGRGPEWESLLRDVVSVGSSLLDLIGEPDSLENADLDVGDEDEEV
jgi:hypothetical protein